MGTSCGRPLESDIVSKRRLQGGCLLFWVLVCCPCAGLADAGQPNAAAKRPYCLRVLLDYEICWLEPKPADGNGRFVLMRRIGLSGRQPVVDPIRRYAVWGRLIVGTTHSVFFVFDTARGGDGNSQSDLVSDRAEWEATLGTYGIPRDISLLDPDDVAASRPTPELYPEDYVFMKGRLGLSDGQWSLTTIVCAFVACAALGLFKANVLEGILASIAIGVAADFVGPMFMTGGGPAAFAGLVVLPGLCFGGWRLGGTIRRWCDRRGVRER